MQKRKITFSRLLKKRIFLRQGPVAVMLHEHKEGRNFVKGIAENLELYRKGNISAKTGIYQNMSGYAELLQSHILRKTIFFSGWQTTYFLIRNREIFWISLNPWNKIGPPVLNMRR